MICPCQIRNRRRSRPRTGRRNRRGLHLTHTHPLTHSHSHTHPRTHPGRVLRRYVRPRRTGIFDELPANQGRDPYCGGARRTRWDGQVWGACDRLRPVGTASAATISVSECCELTSTSLGIYIARVSSDACIATTATDETTGTYPREASANGRPSPECSFPSSSGHRHQTRLAHRGTLASETKKRVRHGL